MLFRLTIRDFKLWSVSYLLGDLHDILDIHVVFKSFEMQNQNGREDVEEILLRSFNGSSALCDGRNRHSVRARDVSERVFNCIDLVALRKR